MSPTKAERRAEALTWSGAKEAHFAQETGTLVVIVDAHAEPVWLDPEGGRWALVCGDHGSIANNETRRQAEWMSASPATWCEGCQAEVDIATRRLPGPPQPGVATSVRGYGA